MLPLDDPVSLSLPESAGRVIQLAVYYTVNRVHIETDVENVVFLQGLWVQSGGSNLECLFRCPDLNLISVDQPVPPAKMNQYRFRASTL